MPTANGAATEEHVEAALNQALAEIEAHPPTLADLNTKLHSPDLSVAKENVPRRGLVTRSRDSFQNHLASLRAEHDKLVRRVAEANEAHRNFLRAAEAELYEIRMVRETIEEAHARLARVGDDD